MSKRTRSYTVCDVCRKDDLFDEVGFENNSDWNIEHGFDVCDNCSQNGEIWHYHDIEDNEDIENIELIPERGGRKWGFLESDSDGEIKFVKWLIV